MNNFNGNNNIIGIMSNGDGNVNRNNMTINHNYGATPDAVASEAAPPPLLTRGERSTLIDLLLQLPGIQQGSMRGLLLNNLPLDLQNAIPDSVRAREHITQIITLVDGSAWTQAGEPWPLVIVLENAMALVKGSVLNTHLRKQRDLVQTRIAGRR